MRAKLILLAVILLSAMSLFAASDSFNAGVTNTGANYFKDDLGKPFGKVIDVAVNFSNISETSIVITDNVAVLFDSDRIYSYDLSTGKESWKYPTDKVMDSAITCSPCAFNGKVYFTTIDTLFCLDELTGKMLWKKTIADTVAPIIKVADGIMYISLDDGKVYRLSVENGENVSDPLVINKQFNGKNKMLISGNNLVTTQDNSLVCTDIKTGKQKFIVQIPSSAISFTPLLLDKYLVVTSGEQIVAYNIANGREIGRKRMPEAVVASPVSDGKYIYVPCFDSKIYALNFDKKLSVAFDDLQTANNVESIIALSDKNILVVDTKGLVSSYDLVSKALVWQYQPGMYTQGGVMNAVPGMGKEDITALTEFSGNNGMSMGGNPGMGGGPGGPGGQGGRGGRRGGRGMGAPRAQGLDEFLGSFSEGTVIMAQRGGRGGMMGGGNPGMGGINAEPVKQKVINYVNVLTPNGNVYDVDMDKFYNDPGREFIPSPVISQPCYMNGYLGFVSIDGHFRLRKIDSSDTTAPYIFEYVPGCASDNRVVSANADILVKIYVFDKGSGIDFRTAKLTVTDSQNKVFDVKLMYDPVKCAFFGYIRNNDGKNSVSNPFADGKMDCVFTVSDYAGNVLTKKYNFRVDASVATKEDNINSGSYYDVDTGKILDVDFVDFNNGTVKGFSGSIAGGKGSSNGGANGSSVNSSDNGNKGGVSGIKAGDEKKK